MKNEVGKYWFLAIVCLLAIIISGGVLLYVKQSKIQPVEIVISESPPIRRTGQVYIGGAVAVPGFYSFKENDTITSLLQAAGDVTSEGDPGRIKIYVPKASGIQEPQKININRAEAWLLEVLPGVGPAKAQAIIKYRTNKGPFLRIEDLLKVEGIGRDTLDRIKEFIVVEE